MGEPGKVTTTRRRRSWAGAALLALVAAAFYVRFAMPFIPEYGKGGIGIAEKGAYVMTEGDVNSAICGEHGWRGRNRQIEETITCGSDGAVPFKLSMLTRRSLIIHFTPDRIYIFDAKEMDGGYYSRD